MLRFIRLLCQLLLVLVVAKSAYAQTAIPDTQNPKDKLSTPAEALKSIKLPPLLAQRLQAILDNPEG